MAHNPWEIPQSLAVVTTKAAWLIAQAGTAELVGDDYTHDFRELVRVHGAVMLRLLTESVELFSQRRYTLRQADPIVLVRYNFPAAGHLFLLARCHINRPADWVAADLAPDEFVYILTAPPGQSEGVTVRRLI